MAKCKYDGTGVWAGRCTGTREVEPCIGHDKCPNYKPVVQTNADRIRAMSDEELADWIARTQITNVAEALAVARIPYEQEDGLKDEVAKECLEWLKQPAEEGAEHG